MATKTKLQIKPVDNWILIDRKEARDKTDGGIILPEQAKGKSLIGTVVAAGPGTHLAGIFVKMNVKPGTVFYMEHMQGMKSR